MFFMRSSDDILNFRLDFFGCIEAHSDELESRNFTELVDLIKIMSMPNYDGEDSDFTVRKLKKQVRKSSINLFKNINLMVPYISEQDFEILMWRSLPENAINEKIKTRNIFKIPVEFDQYAKCHYLCSNFVSHDDIPILLKKITLTREFPDIFYIHEIGHALINRNKGIVENYLHCEFVPILLELIYTYLNYGNEKLKNIQNCRIINLKRSIESFEGPDSTTIEKDKYLLSTLKAFYAFEIFKSLDEVVKKQYIIDLSMIINGNLILEDFLEKYEINFDNIDVSRTLMKVLRI